nr:hypothetical protein [uncultured Lichenicoccus sp.]
MNGNQSAADSIRSILEAMHKDDIKPVSDQWSAGMRALRAVDQEQPDPYEPTLRAGVQLLIALEAMAKATKETIDILRAEIARSMADTGCPGLYLEHHHVTPVEGQRAVLITDEAALALAHPDLMGDPKPPVPDKRAIASRLRAGEPLTGAVLANEPPKPGIRINTIKSKAA